MNKNDTKSYGIQYSKKITLLTFILFCACVIKCFSVDISNSYDLSMHVAIITSSGALCLTTTVWYLKNSQAEKVAKIKARTYKIISDERFKYNKRMLELKSEYGYTEEDILDVENNSPLDELEEDALNSMNESIDNYMDEAVTSIETQIL